MRYKKFTGRRTFKKGKRKFGRGRSIPSYGGSRGGIRL